MQNNFHNQTCSIIKTLVVLDFLILSLNLLFINNTLANLNKLSVVEHIEWLLIVVLCQLIFLSLGLYYTKLRESALGIIKRLIIVFVICFILISFMKLTFLSEQYTSLILMEFCLSSLLCCAICRFFFIKFNLLAFNRRNVLILGSGERAQIIESRMRRAVDQHGFKIIGFVNMPGDKENKVSSDRTIKMPDNFFKFIFHHNIHEVVIANDERRGKLPINDLFLCKLKGVKITDILDFIEHETGQIAVNLMYPSWLIYSEGFNSTNEMGHKADFLFNAVLAGIFFALTWPLMLMAIIAIKIEDGPASPCIYRQNRVGLDGKLFQILKFRSMRTDAEKNGATWAKAEDNRVTKVGKFMRKYRIDELPQLYNVLVGDMGFVGPRPERPEFVEVLKPKIPYYNERHNVKSGLTGWAQLKYPYGSSEADAEEKLKYDLYYIKHRSFLLDLFILIQTAEIVLLGRGR